MHACYVVRRNSRVTAGDDKGEAIDGWVLYLSLMSLAAWRGGAQRGKRRRDTERERVVMLSLNARTHTQINLLFLNCRMTVKTRQLENHVCGRRIPPQSQFHTESRGTSRSSSSRRDVSGRVSVAFTCVKASVSEEHSV